MDTHELNKLTIPICSVDINRVKIGTVITESPLEKTEAVVYTTADFTPKGILANLFFIIILSPVYRSN